MTTINKYLIEGLDRLGKDTLINGIMDKRGFHQTIHFSKPVITEFYKPIQGGLAADEVKRKMLYSYQRASFLNMFILLHQANSAKIICNRAHLGECVYAPLYRGYSGDYVFDLENTASMEENTSTRLILLTEDFATSRHFIDDGESFDITKREKEQELFLAAFERSRIRDKRIICVTDLALGGFKRKDFILEEALA